MEILSSILQFKLVRNPAEELLCLVLICCSAENKSKQNRQIPVPTNSSEAGRCTILHPQYKSSSTVSCLQKIRILTLTFGRRRQFRDGLEKQCRALGIKHYSIPINMPVRWSSTHTMIDKFYRMKDAIIAVLASQGCDDSILNFQSLIGLFLRNSQTSSVSSLKLCKLTITQLSIELSLNTSALSVDQKLSKIAKTSL